MEDFFSRTVFKIATKKVSVVLRWEKRRALQKLAKSKGGNS